MKIHVSTHGEGLLTISRFPCQFFLLHVAMLVAGWCSCLFFISVLHPFFSYPTYFYYWYRNSSEVYKHAWLYMLLHSVAHSVAGFCSFSLSLLFIVTTVVVLDWTRVCSCTTLLENAMACQPRVRKMVQMVSRKTKLWNREEKEMHACTIAHCKVYVYMGIMQR